MFVGPMFGSKTTRLIAALDRYKYQKKKILAFKPYVDDRYASDEIVTHNGGRVSARCVSSGADIVSFAKSESCDVIAIDEAFMIPEVDEAVISLYKMGITVLLSSLDLSSKGEPFKSVRNIMSWATDIIKCPSVCPICGEDAHFTYRKFDDDRDLLIGGSEMYEPRCFNHYILNPDDASFIDEN